MRASPLPAREAGRGPELRFAEARDGFRARRHRMRLSDPEALGGELIVDVKPVLRGVGER